MCMHRITGHATGCATYLCRILGMAGCVTTGLATQPPMVGNGMCVKMYGYIGESQY